MRSYLWGMIYSACGVRPDPEKIDALKDLTHPTTKEDLKSFICMMQSNAELPNFSVKIHPLRQLLLDKSRFMWKELHQKTFEMIIGEFKKYTLLNYFDINKNTYVVIY